MSVKLIGGDTFRVVDKELFERIKAENNFSSPIVLIVPDQYTQAIEREMFETLGIKCSFNIEVTSFYRLAKRMVKSSRAELNQQTSVLLLSKVINQNKGKLKCYKSIAARNQFANEMYAVITSIRNNLINATSFERVARETVGYSSAKFQDIAMVMREYMREINENYSDISSILDTFRESVGDYPEIARTSYYIMDFYAMTKNKRAIVEALMDGAKSVTVGVVDIRAKANGRLMPSDTTALINMAESRGAKLSRVEDDSLSLSRAHVLSGLFAYDQYGEDALDNAFDLAALRSEDEEVLYVAQRIRKAIESGYRYKDIAIVFENGARYAGLIQRYFAEYEIAYFLDDKVSMATLPQYKLLDKAVKVIGSNYRASEVISLVKESLFEGDYNEKCVFENYVLQYNVNRGQFKTAFTLGESVERDISERIRVEVCEYLTLLEGKNAACASEQVDNISAFFERAKAKNISGKIGGENALSRELIDLAWGKIETTLAQTKLMLGQLDTPLANLLRITLDCLSSIRLSLAPIKIDSVFVGGIEESRFERVKLLFVLGAKEDTYPISSNDNGILREEEVTKLSQKGILIEPTRLERSKQNKFYIAQLLMRASDSVTITCPKRNSPVSSVMQQLSKMLGIGIATPEVAITGYENTLEIATKIGTKRNYEEILCRYIGGGGRKQTREVMSALYAKSDHKSIENMQNSVQKDYNAPHNRTCFKDNYLKISGIERFYSCPFMFYTDSMLKLKARREGAVEINEMGSFIHRVLELYFTENKARDLTCEQVSKCSAEIVKRVLNEEEFQHFSRQDSSNNYVQQLIIRCDFTLQSLNKMQQRSSFTPTYLEYDFGMPGSLSEPLTLTLGDKVYKVRGKIDRVDTEGEEVTLIDYKSSLKSLAIDNIFDGQHLQLVAYLEVILRDTKKRCAGIYYLGLPYKYDSGGDSEKRFAYDGFIRANEESIAAQDSEYLDKNKCFLPLKYVKIDSAYRPIIVGGNTLSDEEFAELGGYVKKLLTKTIEIIDSGFIKPSPRVGACEYCEYKTLCGRGAVVDIERHKTNVMWSRHICEDKNDGGSVDNATEEISKGVSESRAQAEGE